MGRFDGQVAWVTGGSSGIGRALAVELARQGAGLVAVSGRREDRLAETVAAVEQAGGAGLAVPCDVTDEGAVLAAADRIADHGGKLDTVVANAGFGVAGRFEKLELADWRRQFDVNVFGAISTVKASLPHLRESRGRIGLVGSVMAYITFSKNGPYCASKAAVRAIGETLNLELHSAGVTTTVMHPGFVATELGQVDNRGVFKAERKDPRPGALMWQPQDAARVMARALYRRRRELVFTAHGKLGVFVSQKFPTFTRMALAGRG